MAINPSNFLFPEQWSLKIIKASEAWGLLNSHSADLTFGSPNVIIAILDDGLDDTHPAFKQTLSDGSDKIYSPGNFDFLSSPIQPNISDAPYLHNYGALNNQGHGVLCAGVATAFTSLDPSLEGIAGVAGNCKVMGVVTPGDLPSTVLTPTEPDYTRTEKRYAQVFKWSAGVKVINESTLFNGIFPDQLNLGADIISVSQGILAPDNTPYTPYGIPIQSVMSQALDMVAAFGRKGRGSLMFLSAGNSGIDLDATNFRPLTLHDKTITVGSSSINFHNGFEEVWPLLNPYYINMGAYSDYGKSLDFVTPSSSDTGQTRQFIPDTPDNKMALRIITTVIRQDHPIDPSTEHGGDTPGNPTFITSLVDPTIIDQTNIILSNAGNINKLGALIGDPGALHTEAGNKLGVPYSNQVDLKDPRNDAPVGLLYPHSANTNVFIGRRDYYSAFGKTSASTPVAAGIAALILTAQPNLSWVEVRDIMRMSAVKINMGFGIPYTPYNLPYPNDTSGIGKWTGSDGITTVVDAPLVDTVNITQAIIRNPVIHESDTIHVSDSTNYRTGDAIKIEDSSSYEWRYVLGVDHSNHILTIDPIVEALYSINGTVSRSSVTPARSDVYGYGRLDANAAVALALAHDFSARDLKIRDVHGDNGTPNASNTLINSPDIWTRRKSNANDGNNWLPNSFGDDGPSQQISRRHSTYLYARVNNIGPSGSPTTKSNLDAWVRFYIALSDAAPLTQPSFSFPDNWLGYDDISKLYDSGTKVQFIDEVYIPEGTVEYGSSNNAIKSDNWVEWIAAKKPHHDNKLRTFILAHVTPFDGGVAATEVYNNNNLTYKEIFIPGSPKVKTGDGLGYIPDKIPVDINGLVSTIGINIELLNLPFDALNGIAITAKITYNNLTTQTVLFGFNSNNNTWEFDNIPTWLDLNSPIASGANTNFQEVFTFSGNLHLSNLYSLLEFNVKSIDADNIIITDRDLTYEIVPDYPIPATGISSEKKTKIHTFTDFDLLPSQTGNNNFGPVDGALTTEYSTWSAFSGVLNNATQLKAYAVTDGEFFIQEVTGNPAIVNLILKPDAQPESHYGHVKYFVYRGIKKSSFLDNNGNVLSASTSGLSELLTRMWTVRQNLNLEANINEVLERNDFALDDQTNVLAPSESVDSIFDTYVFQRVTPGMWIGDFEFSGNYGFQIVLDGPNHTMTLADLRVLDHKIVVSYVGGQPQFTNNQEEDISTKLMREKILSYIDTVAYFGLLAHDKIQLHRTSGGGGDTELDNSNDINSNILSKFTTNDRIYIDIRNELNNSLNFYGSYSDPNNTTTKVASIKVNANDKEYHINGWPILIIPVTEFNASNSEDFVGVDLSLPQGDNDLPSVFLSGASFFADGLGYKNKFQLPVISSNYTDSISLSIANSANTTSNGLVLPFAVKFIYARRYDLNNLVAIPGTLKRPWKDDHLDNLLSRNEIIPTSSAGDPNNTTTVTFDSSVNHKYIGWTSLQGSDFLMRTGLAKDSIGEVAFGFIQGPNEVAGTTSTKTLSSSIDLEKKIEPSPSFYLLLQESLKAVRLNKRIITINPPVTVIQADSVHGKLSVDILNKSADDLLTFAYTTAEASTIQNVENTMLSGITKYFIAMNHQLLNDTDDYVYYTCELGIQGAVYDTNTFTHVVSRIGTGLIFYSIDGRNYMTENYAQALESLLPESSIYL